MRIQFTDNGNTYTIETIKSFAKYLACKISDGSTKPGQTKFVADFALTSYDDDDRKVTIPEILDDVRESGWYGVKELGEIGFNSINRQFAFDYYGGQHLRIYDFDESFMEKDDAERRINQILTSIFDVSYDTCLLLVQWNEDKCLVEDAREQENLNVETEAVECCPHCDCENVYPNWDVKTQGYVAKCKGCGEDILLCDECLHADDNPGQKCDWSKERGCFRYPKNQTKPASQPHDDKRYYVDIFHLEDTTDIVVESAWMTEEEARKWFQSTIFFVQYGNYGARLMRAIGEDDCYDIEVVEKLY